jgi:glycosyltransferase involved in cell wall biosynthesis
MNSSGFELSVSIIAKNEEKNLRRCLNSLGGIASEIVLVYNDCSDDTLLVGKEFNAKCYEEEWCGYKNQKNLAIKKCSYEWILCLDADEALSIELRNNITNFLSDPCSSDYNGASFNRCSYFMGKWIRHGEWYPDRKSRLFRAKLGAWSGGDLHEHLAIDGEIHHLAGDLLHYSYNSILDFPGKMSLYANAFAQQKMNEGTTVSKMNLLTRPVWRFLRAYILRFGFLDGIPGFVIAMCNSYECLLKYCLTLEKLNSNIESK